MNHQTRRVVHGGQELDVDAGIAELLEAMWALGIETSQSCESMDGWTWIVLDDVSDLSTLLSAVGPTDLFDCLREWEVAAPFMSNGRDLWRYHLGPIPLDDDRREWVFEVTVEFPPEQVPAVTEALRLAVAG